MQPNIGSDVKAEKDILVGALSAPNTKVIEAAKEEAKKLFPLDEAKQKEYTLTKGAATMKLSLIPKE